MTDAAEEAGNTGGNVKLNYGMTFLIGFGFMTTGLAWSIYNVKIPLILSYFLPSFTWTDFLIGIVMVLDNITAIFLQPYFGAKSDKTKSKFGKRIPYLMIGIPFGVLAFVLIPFSANLATLITLIMVYNILMALYRSPVVALMPDLTPSEVRAKGNAIINLMGGFGTIGSYIIGSLLLDIDPSGALAFSVVGIIMLVSFFIVFFTVNEMKITARMVEKYGSNFASDKTELKEFRSKDLAHLDHEGKKSLRDRFKTSDIAIIFREKEKSALFMLIAIFCWFFAYNGIEAFFSLYAVNVLGISPGSASTLLLFLPLAFILFALPAGIISEKIGRRKAIKIGLLIVIGAVFVLIFAHNFVLIVIMFLVLGAAWSMININSITVVWQLAPDGKIGAYTGIYYLFSALAAITSPVFAGFLFSITDSFLGALRYTALFPFSLAFMIIALLFVFKVKRGEVVLTKKEIDDLKNIYEEGD
ncbi:MAG: MFS transporter [Promethearchaeota archaeon]